MAATTNLLTVEEFRKLPDDKGPVYHELRHGEVVSVTRPKYKHGKIQIHVRDLIKAIAAPGAYVSIEVPFRPLPEHELWAADIAYLSLERESGVDPDDNILGAPDLVIEVLSPSNTVNEMFEREKLCHENGTKEFWVLDQDRHQVKVSTPDGHTRTYRSGESIPLPLFGGATLAVDTVFDWQPRRG